MAVEVELFSDTFDTSIGAGWANGLGVADPYTANGSGGISPSAAGAGVLIRRNGESYDNDQWIEAILSSHSDTNLPVFAVSVRGAASTSTPMYQFGVVGTNSFAISHKYEILEYNGTEYDTEIVLATAGTAGNLPANSKVKIWVEGTAITGFTDEGAGYVQRATASDATITSGSPGIGGYQETVATGTVITSARGGNLVPLVVDSVTPTTFEDGQTGIVIACDGAGATQDDGRVVISAVDDISGSQYPNIAALGANLAVTNGTSNALNMPAGIVAGDLLIAFVAHDTSGTVGLSGWSDITNTANGTAARLAIFAKIAAGSDTGTVTGSNNDLCAKVIRIPAARHGVTDVTTDILKGTAATGSSNAPNPPSVSSLNSSLKYLVLEACASDDDDDTANYQTSGYTPVSQFESASSTSSCLLSIASLELTGATSVDPGNMALNATEEWVTQTLVIPQKSVAAPEEQTVTAWADDEITITAVQGSLPADVDLRLFVENDDGQSNTNGAVVQFQQASEIEIDAGFQALEVSEKAASVGLSFVTHAVSQSLLLTEHSASVSLAKSVQASTEHLVLTEQSANVNAGRDISAGHQNIHLSEQSANVSVGKSVSAGYDQLTIAEQSATVSLSRNIAATVDSLILSGLQAAVNRQTSIQADAETLTLEEHGASITVSRNVLAGVQALSLAEYPSQVRVLTGIGAQTENLQLSEQSASVSLSRHIAADYEQLVLSEHGSTVLTSAGIAAGIDTLILAEQTASVTLAKAVAAQVQQLLLTDHSALVTVGLAMHAATEQLRLSEYPAVVNRGNVITCTSEALRLLENAAQVSVTTGIQAVAESLILTESPSSVTLAKAISAGTQEMTLAGMQAQIGLSSQIQAAIESLILTDNDAVVALAKNVQAAVEHLVLTGQPATVEGVLEIIHEVVTRFTARAPQTRFTARAPQTRFRTLQ